MILENNSLQGILGLLRRGDGVGIGLRRSSGATTRQGAIIGVGSVDAFVEARSIERLICESDFTDSTGDNRVESFSSKQSTLFRAS